MIFNYKATGITAPDEEQVALSSNGHYAIYVQEREEEDFPGSVMPRYEIVNLSTLAVEGRVHNLYMALHIMEEYDRRLEDVCVNGLPQEEVVGTPVGMHLGKAH